MATEHTSKPQSDTQEPRLPAAATPNWKSRIVTRAALKRLKYLVGVLGLALVACYFVMVSMPGRSHIGPLPPATDSQRALAERLQSHVVRLAGQIGGRSTFQPQGMVDAAMYIMQEMERSGYAKPEESFVKRGARTPNLEYTLPGTNRRGEIVVVGAHYDSYQGTPGADDNASGVAGLIELARALAERPQARTVRFVFFVNEEPPAFWTEDMGSLVYARLCRARNDNIVAMLSLETIGYYTSKPGSQDYPRPLNWLYPDTGNFVAFVGNVQSRGLTRRTVRTFRDTTPFPSEGAALVSGLPGIGWSDHWAFWEVGYPAVMVTDTAPFRNPNYHDSTDTPETLDYDSLSRVVEGLERVVIDLASGPGF